MGSSSRTPQERGSPGNRSRVSSRSQGRSRANQSLRCGDPQGAEVVRPPDVTDSSGNVGCGLSASLVIQERSDVSAREAGGEAVLVKLAPLHDRPQVRSLLLQQAQ